MSESEVIENEEETSQADSGEETAEKIVLPKLDNVNDDLLGDRAAAVIEHIVQSLVENKDDAEVEVVETGDNSVELHVHTHVDEIGRVIGKKGRVVQASRKMWARRWSKGRNFSLAYFKCARALRGGI